MMNFTKTVFINSAVAFFFLFFLHGFSIGNGQQGISYNAQGLQMCKNWQHLAKLKNNGCRDARQPHL